MFNFLNEVRSFAFLRPTTQLYFKNHTCQGYLETIIITFDQFIIDLNEKNLPTILIEGGIGEFPILKKNNVITAIETTENKPLLIIIYT